MAVISLVLYFYIIKQRKRTAIERALGMTNRQCALSLLAGILLLTAVGAVAGCATGEIISGIVQDRVLSADRYFSTAYSRGLVNVNGNAPEAMMEINGGWMPFLFTAIGTMVLVLLLSLALIRKNLSIAPICLLSLKGNE